MTILVTGALGQVGKALVRKLVEEKAAVIGLDKREENIFPEVKISVAVFGLLILNTNPGNWSG